MAESGDIELADIAFFSFMVGLHIDLTPFFCL